MWGPGLAESDAVTFLLYSQFHGSQRTKQLQIFEFSRPDSNTFPLLYITVGKVIKEILRISEFKGTQIEENHIVKNKFKLRKKLTDQIVLSEKYSRGTNKP